MSTLLAEITLCLQVNLYTTYTTYNTIPTLQYSTILILFIKEYLCHLQSIFKGTYTALRLLTTYLRFVRVSIKSKDEKINEKDEGHETEREKKREPALLTQNSWNKSGFKKQNSKIK